MQLSLLRARVIHKIRFNVRQVTDVNLIFRDDERTYCTHGWLLSDQLNNTRKNAPSKFVPLHLSDINDRVE